MLRRFWWRYKIFLGVLMALLIGITRIWQPQYLIVPKPLMGFVEYTELSIPLFLLLPVSFLLHDRFEIELGLVCGVSTRKLLFFKWIPLWGYAVISHVMLIMLYRYKQFWDFGQYRPKIPIFVPEYYKVYLIFSSVVTITFFAALFLFLRVITRNSYLTVCLGLFAYVGLQSLNMRISNGIVAIEKSLFDPFVSTYFLGNEVPNSITSINIPSLWTWNRLGFFIAGILLLLLSYLILRLEKLHYSFGE